MGIFTAILGLFSTVTKGIFGLKTEQSSLIKSSLDVINNVNTSERDRAIAFANYMSAESNSGYWLAACIRPLIALLLVILVTAWFFGYAPPNLEKEMPPFISKSVDCLMVFIGFYVPGRSLEKIVTTLTNSKIIQSYLNKLV